MIVYAPRRVTLAPHEPQSIRIAARPPQGLPDGEYRVHLLFRAIPPSTPVTAAGDAPPRASSSQLIPVYGVTIPVIVRLGNLEATAGISNVALEKKDGKTSVSLDLSRSGIALDLRRGAGAEGRRQGPDRDPEDRSRSTPRSAAATSPSRSTTRYKGDARGPGHRPVYRDLSRREREDRRNTGGAALGRGTGARGSSSCWAAAIGCARPRCCWRFAPAASARPRRPTPAPTWTADPDDQFLLDVHIRQLVLGDGVRAYNAPEGTCVVLGDFLTALDVPMRIDLTAQEGERLGVQGIQPDYHRLCRDARQLRR